MSIIILSINQVKTNKCKRFNRLTFKTGKRKIRFLFVVFWFKSPLTVLRINATKNGAKL